MARIIENHAELAAQIAREKAAGKTIVFTNGAFDLLHVGHTRYLQGAADEGDVLVVALNSDESVRALKGPGRPIQPLAERLETIAALAGVDYVTSFTEPNVAGLLLLLRPHVHAKGSDYTVDTVPEVETVRGYGGRVAITGGPKDHNTTDIVARIEQSGGKS